MQDNESLNSRNQTTEKINQRMMAEVISEKPKVHELTQHLQ